MSLKDCIDKNNKLFNLHFQIKGLIEEYNREFNHCQHEIVFNFQKDEVERKIGPSDIHICLGCQKKYAKPLDSFNPVDDNNESLEENDVKNPFMDSMIIDVSAKTGKIIDQGNRLMMLIKIKWILDLELLKQPNLTILEFCELFNQRVEDCKLSVKEKTNIKLKKKN